MAAASFPGRVCLVLVAASVGLSLLGCSGDRLEEFRSEEGRFRILLPGTPTLEQTPDLPSGVKSFRLEQQSGEYVVAWEKIDLRGTARTAQDRLDGACDRAIEMLKGKELSRKEISLDGKYPGRELLVEGPRDRRVVRDRMYLVDSRLYHVMVSGPRWWVESRPAKKVLDSFQLIEE
jgi:hypothetical protein